MNKIIGLIGCVVLMSSCVSYQVQRPYYDSEQELNEIISSKSIILIVDSFKYGAKPPKKVSNNYFANRFRNSFEYRLINPPDDFFPSNGHPKAIKDFKLIDGIISGVIIEIPKKITHFGENDLVEVIKNPSYYNYFKKGQSLKNTFPKRKFRDAREVVCLFTPEELKEGPFSIAVSTLLRGSSGEIVTYKVDRNDTLARNFALLVVVVGIPLTYIVTLMANVWGAV